MDYDFKFAGSNFDRNKNCRKMDMTRGTFIQQLKAQYDTQEHYSLYDSSY